MGVTDRDEQVSPGEPQGAAGTPDRPVADHPERPLGDRVEDYLGFRSRLVMGVVFAALYIATFGPRTGWLPGVVSGVLGGVVVFLLLKEVDARVKRRLREQRGRHR
jgi:hypothetical protein